MFRLLYLVLWVFVRRGRRGWRRCPLLASSPPARRSPETRTGARGSGACSSRGPATPGTVHRPETTNQRSVSTTTIHQSQLTLRDWRLELALSMPAISAEARLLDSFLKRLLVLRRLSASRFLCRSLAAVTFLLEKYLVVNLKIFTQ